MGSWLKTVVWVGGGDRHSEGEQHCIYAE